MSVEATGWAFRQKIPPKPKMVLMALADQADERTGRVCYGKTDVGHLADKASVPERSFYRYLGALVRNGYVIRQSGKEKGQPSAYWLCLDRPMATRLDEWTWSAASEADTQDVDDGSATVADPPIVENEVEGLPDNGTPGLPIGGRPIDSSEEPKNVSGRAIEGRSTSFSREAQDADRESRAIERIAHQANARVFVIENSRAWQAWCDWRRKRGQVPSFPTCQGQGEFAGKRGWPMPSLFPPNYEGATGPPTSPTMSEDDESVLANGLG